MERDYAFGISMEDIQKPELEKHFGCKLEKTQNQFSRYDFYNQNERLYIELKNRRIQKDTYPSTMVGYDKIEYALKHNLEDNFWFVFGFADGSLWKWRYNIDDINISRGGRCDRGRNEYKTYAFIRCDKLECISSGKK